MIKVERKDVADPGIDEKVKNLKFYAILDRRGHARWYAVYYINKHKNLTYTLNLNKFTLLRDL